MPALLPVSSVAAPKVVEAKIVNSAGFVVGLPASDLRIRRRPIRKASISANETTSSVVPTDMPTKVVGFGPEFWFVPKGVGVD